MNLIPLLHGFAQRTSIWQRSLHLCRSVTTLLPDLNQCALVDSSEEQHNAHAYLPPFSVMSNLPPVYLYKPSWIANTFLLKAGNDGVGDVDPLKIQKLVYCFHGWHLATTGSPAVGERFEAWPMGPVSASLYHQFKRFRWNPITEYAKEIDPLTGESKALVVPPSDEQFTRIFNLVWERYRGLSGVELSALTHAPGTPWSKARAAGQQYIFDDDIRQHFIELGRKAA